MTNVVDDHKGDPGFSILTENAKRVLWAIMLGSMDNDQLTKGRFYLDGEYVGDTVNSLNRLGMIDFDDFHILDYVVTSFGRTQL